MTTTRTRIRRTSAAATAIALGLLGVGFAAQSASAVTDYPVSNTNDSGVGSLRQAIIAANGNAGHDTITITATGTLTILSTLTVTDGVDIIGPGQANFTITSTAVPLYVDVALGVASDTDFSMSGLVLDGPANPAVGGGVLLENVVPVHNAQFTDMTIKNFTGPTGGRGVQTFGMSGKLSFTDTTFNNNHTLNAGITDNGAGLQASGILGGVEITGGAFTNNAVVQRGGGAVISAGAAAVTITGTTFSNNVSSTDAGAGLTVDSASLVTVSGATFNGNLAVNSGAALSINAVSAIVTGSSFTLNTSSGNRGGAIYLNLSGDASIVNTGFAGNTAAFYGGAVNVQAAAKLTVSGSTFENNEADAGGAIYVASFTSDSSISGSVFDNNRAVFGAAADSGHGGAVSLGNVDPALTTIAHPFTIFASTFTDNIAAAVGGAVFVPTVGAAGYLFVDSSTFSGSDALAGLSIAGTNNAGLISVVNSTFDEAVQGTKYAVELGNVLATGTVLLSHSTLVGSPALKVTSNAGDVFLSHDIIDPTAGSPVLAIGGLAAGVEWSIFTSATVPSINSVAGNRFSVPAAAVNLGPLQNNGGTTLTLAPLPGSVAINTGNPAVFGEPVFDQRGTGFDRTVNVIDIGSVESQVPTVPTVPAKLAATGGTINYPLLIGGGIVVLLGIGAIVYTRIRKRDNSGS